MRVLSYLLFSMLNMFFSVAAFAGESPTDVAVVGSTDVPSIESASSWDLSNFKVFLFLTNVTEAFDFANVSVVGFFSSMNANGTTTAANATYTSDFLAQAQNKTVAQHIRDLSTVHSSEARINVFYSPFLELGDIGKLGVVPVWTDAFITHVISYEELAHNITHFDLIAQETLPAVVASLWKFATVKIAEISPVANAPITILMAIKSAEYVLRNRAKDIINIEVLITPALLKMIVPVINRATPMTLQQMNPGAVHNQNNPPAITDQQVKLASFIIVFGGAMHMAEEPAIAGEKSFADDLKTMVIVHGVTLKGLTLIQHLNYFIPTRAIFLSKETLTKGYQYESPFKNGAKDFVISTLLGGTIGGLYYKISESLILTYYQILGRVITSGVVLGTLCGADYYLVRGLTHLGASPRVSAVAVPGTLLVGAFYVTQILHGLDDATKESINNLFEFVTLGFASESFGK